jgi:hypothetical protein
MFNEEKKFVKEAPERVAGILCQVIQDEELGDRLWIWGRIFLKTKWGEIGEKGYGTVATSVDQQSEIPDSLFMPPLDIAYK